MNYNKKRSIVNLTIPLESWKKLREYCDAHDKTMKEGTEEAIDNICSQEVEAGLLLRLVRTVDGWLDILNKIIPPKDQTEAMWFYIVNEAYLPSIDVIPVRFRSARILAAWVSSDAGHIQNIPKDYWSKKLKRMIHKVVDDMIDASMTVEELDMNLQAVEQLRKEQGIKKNEPIIRVPTP